MRHTNVSSTVSDFFPSTEIRYSFHLLFFKFVLLLKGPGVFQSLEKEVRQNLGGIGNLERRLKTKT